ncbi:MAG: hypothetical protein A2096_03210 [Spirochaetes bacterium GWF1_41_5]|nr:MAG: hypothetical protein A2096_03210 [Spirochaetes bacterium GWF1_41_5]HBE02012.1 hypothetical protein [Spirochaetia bacterium]
MSDHLYKKEDGPKKWIIYGIEDLRDQKLYKKVISHREDGSLLSIEEFFNNKHHGECAYYNPDGTLYEKRYYQHGTIFGPYEKYYRDGTIERRIIY